MHTYSRISFLSLTGIDPLGYYEIVLLSERLRLWRGRLYQKEAAAKLDLPLPTYRKYEKGKRTPNKLAMAELERRLETRK